MSRAAHASSAGARPTPVWCSTQKLAIQLYRYSFDRSALSSRVARSWVQLAGPANSHVSFHAPPRPPTFVVLLAPSCVPRRIRALIGVPSAHYRARVHECARTRSRLHECVRLCASPLARDCASYMQLRAISRAPLRAKRQSLASMWAPAVAASKSCEACDQLLSGAAQSQGLVL